MWRHLVGEYAAAVLEGKQAPPVPAVAYPDDGREKFILLDGHHRTRVAFMVGRQTVQGEILETDDELADWIEQEALGWLPRKTIDCLHDRYTQLWRPKLMDKGIRTIGDLPLAQEKLEYPVGFW